MDVVYSVRGEPIRLTAERWFHIVENHDDLAGYYDAVLEVVESPDLVLTGYRGSQIAVRGYDREADVLYISFRRPQDADDSVMTDEGILLRYRQEALVGVTVLDAAQRTS